MRRVPAPETSAMAERIPPGRAGRLWLLDRLAAARGGANLLDRKRQLLRREYEQLVELAGERRRAWTDACADAQRWGMRVAMAGGAAELVLDAGGVAGSARATLIWTTTMGVRHPEDARCELPQIDPAVVGAAVAAVGPAAAAYRRALEFGVAVAVAETARDHIERELRATQQRLRGIQRKRIPALEGGLQALELQLEELEREERVITRWAKQSREGNG
jgi:V/A-type H+-transporting ATPase subunit D